jgi:hypothetical protein
MSAAFRVSAPRQTSHGRAASDTAPEPDRAIAGTGHVVPRALPSSATSSGGSSHSSHTDTGGPWVLGACGASKVRPPGAPAESPGRPECRSRRNGLGSVLIAWCRPRGPRRRWLPPALRSGSRRGRGRVGVIAERRSPQQDRTSEVVRTDSGGAPWLPTAAPPPSRRSRSPWSCSHAGTPQSATPPWFAPSHGAAITGRD